MKCTKKGIISNDTSIKNAIKYLESCNYADSKLTRAIMTTAIEVGIDIRNNMKITRK